MGLQGQVKFWCGEMMGGIMWNRKTVAPWTSQKVEVWRPDDQGLTWCRGNEAEGWGTSSRKGVSDVESTLPWWPTIWVRYYLEGGRTVDIKLLCVLIFKKWQYGEGSLRSSLGTSLVVQWLRLCPPNAGGRVCSLVGEPDPSCHS